MINGNILKLSGIGASVIVVHGYILYKLWRYTELVRIEKKSIEFIVNGYVEVPSISPIEKLYIWEYNLYPRLVRYWKKVINKFDVKDPNTWPQPENGRAYETTLRCEERIAGMPKIFSSNYDVQAIIGYIFDQELSLVHYSDKSHWKYLLLCDPLALLIPLYLYKCLYPYRFLVHIQGNDFSWNILNWPNIRHGISGKCIPQNTHIDGGEKGIYEMSESFLPQISADINRNARSIQLLSTLLHQLGIIFYCDTPGYLGKDEGCTALLPKSHLAIMEALRRYSLSNQFQKEYPLRYRHIIDSLKHFGEKYSSRMVQPSIPDGRAILVLGMTAHSSAWAVRSMSSNCTSGELVAYPRSMQNAKISCADAGASIFHALKPNSLIRRLIDNPSTISELKYQICRDGDFTFQNDLTDQADYLLRKWNSR